MKRITSFFLAVCLALPLFAQGRGKVNIPDLKGYVTLKCDLHLHTVFSDGTVWPTVRIDEAYREGVDVISITDHIEVLPHKADVFGSHNRSYEIIKPAAESRGIILIKGSEITRSMPPGHHNAIFITNSNELDKPDYMNAFRAAKSQNAFFFWNHPRSAWMPEHTQLMQQGMLNGVEVANNRSYYPDAHRWCLDKKLTMIGNSDAHGPIPNFAPGQHRTMTLVFARSATLEAIREALNERRTAVYYDNYVIGEEKYLKELFENALEWDVTKTDNGALITIRNKSDLTFRFRKNNSDARLMYLTNTLDPLTVNPKETQIIRVGFSDGIKGGDVNIIVENFLVQPSAGMAYTIKI